jgi:hypothetical protein
MRPRFRRDGSSLAFITRGRNGQRHSDMGMTRLKAWIGSLARRIAVLLAFPLLAANFAAAQDKGSVNPEPLPPLANPNDPATPAKELFGRKTTPALVAARTIGFYSRGCIAGAKALPLDGETWQVMR